jgi:hypothetical protein
MDAPHVFISYSRADREYAQRLADFLAGAGVAVWFDYEVQTGDRFGKKIQNAIDSCAAVIALVSLSSTASEWVGREISYASVHKKPILPIRLQECNLPIEIAFLDYLDVRAGQLPPPRFVEQVRALVALAMRPTGRASAPATATAVVHTPVLPPPMGRDKTAARPRRRRGAITLAVCAVLLLGAAAVGIVFWLGRTAPSSGECVPGNWIQTSQTEPVTSIANHQIQLSGPGSRVVYSTNGKMTIYFGAQRTETGSDGQHTYTRTFSGDMTWDYQIVGNQIRTRTSRTMPRGSIVRTASRPGTGPPTGRTSSTPSPVLETY